MSINIGTLVAELVLEDHLSGAVDLAARKLGVSQTTLIGFGLQVERAGESLRKFGQTTSQIGDRATFLAAPMLAAAAASTKMAMTFQTDMTKLVTLAGVGAAALGEMREEVLKLAPAVGKSPDELVKALYSISSVGVRGAESLQVLTRAAKASAIGMGETQDIARAVAGAVINYGDAGMTAAKATDVLVRAVTEGGAEANEFANTLGRVIPVAKLAGVSFEEVAASVATFTRLGVRADEGVTALRGILNAVSFKPTPGAKEALEQLGTSVEQLRDKIKKDGLADALIELVKLAGSNTDALGKIVPNVRALAGALGTAGSQAEAYRDIVLLTKNANGDLDRSFAVTAETAAFKLQQFKASVQVLAVQVGEKLMPAFVSITHAMLPLVHAAELALNLFSKLPEPIQSTALAIGAVVLLSGPFLSFFGRLNELIGIIVSSARFVRLAELLPIISAGFQKLGIAISGSTAAMAANDAAMAQTIVTSHAVYDGRAAAAAAAAMEAEKLGKLGVVLGTVTTAASVAAAAEAKAVKTIIIDLEAAGAAAATFAGEIMLANAGVALARDAAGNAAAQLTGHVRVAKKVVEEGAESFGYWAMGAGVATDSSGRLAKQLTGELAPGARVIEGEIVSASTALVKANTSMVLLGEGATATSGTIVTLGATAAIAAASIAAFFAAGVTATALMTDKTDELRESVSLLPGVIGDLGSIIKSSLILNLESLKAHVVETFGAFRSLGDWMEQDAPVLLQELGLVLQQQLDRWAFFAMYVKDVARASREAADGLASVNRAQQGVKTPQGFDANMPSINLGKPMDLSRLKALKDNLTGDELKSRVNELEQALIDLNAAGLKTPEVILGISNQATELARQGAVLPPMLQELVRGTAQVTLGMGAAGKSATPFATNLGALRKEINDLSPAVRNDLVLGIKAGVYSIQQLADVAKVSPDAVQLFQRSLSEAGREAQKSANFIDRFKTNAANLEKELQAAIDQGVPLSVVYEEFGNQIESVTVRAPLMGEAVGAATAKFGDDIKVKKAAEALGKWKEHLQDITNATQQNLIEQATEKIKRQGEAWIKNQRAIEAVNKETEKMSRRFEIKTLETEIRDINEEYDDRILKIQQTAKVDEDVTGQVVALEKQKKVAIDVATEAWERQEKAIKIQKIIELGNQIRDIGSALGDNWAGHIVSGVGQITSAWGKALAAIELYKTQAGGATKAQKAGAILGGAAEVAAATSSGSTARRTVGGAAAGASAGLAVGAAFAGPTLGTSLVIGAAAGALVGWIRGLSASAKANKQANEEIATMKKELVGTYGSLTNAASAASVFGIDLNSALNGEGTRGAKKLKEALEQIKAKTEELNTAMDRYGISWTDLGETAKRAHVTQTVDEMMKSFKALSAAGVSTNRIVQGMAGDINDFISESFKAGQKIPVALQPIIETLIRNKQLTEENARALLGMSADATPAFKDIEEAAGRYGIKLDELGPKIKQLQINEQAAQIVADWNLLIGAGADVGVVMSGMKDKVQEWVTQALRFGLSLPESMKPMLQAMIDAGKLTDENGDKLNDLSKINFVTPLTDKIDDLITKLSEFIDKLNTAGSSAVGNFGRARGEAEKLGQAIARIPLPGSATPKSGVPESDYHPNDPKPEPEPRAPREPDFPGDDGRRYAAGGIVPPPSGAQGSDTVNAWVAPGELILTAAQQKNLASLLSQRQTAFDTRLEALYSGLADDTTGPNTSSGALFFKLDNTLTNLNKSVMTVLGPVQQKQLTAMLQIRDQIAERRLSALRSGEADDTMSEDTPQGSLFRTLDDMLTSSNTAINNFTSRLGAEKKYPLGFIKPGTGSNVGEFKELDNGQWVPKDHPLYLAEQAQKNLRGNNLLQFQPREDSSSTEVVGNLQNDHVIKTRVKGVDDMLPAPRSTEDRVKTSSNFVIKDGGIVIQTPDVENFRRYLKSKQFGRDFRDAAMTNTNDVGSTIKEVVNR